MPIHRRNGSILRRGRDGNEEKIPPASCFSQRYFVVRQEKGSFFDLLVSFVSWRRAEQVFLEDDSPEWIREKLDKWGHRCVILISIFVRKLIYVVRKPMKFFGLKVNYLLNLLDQNGGVLRLFFNILIGMLMLMLLVIVGVTGQPCLTGVLKFLYHLFRWHLAGRLVVPEIGSDTFIGIIGQLDRRMDLYRRGNIIHTSTAGGGNCIDFESKAVMDLCMMASKLAYENENVVRSVISDHWEVYILSSNRYTSDIIPTGPRLSETEFYIFILQMHFDEFYNCWDGEIIFQIPECQF